MLLHFVRLTVLYVLEFVISFIIFLLFQIEFDKDRDMHAFAMTPIIDNDLVVHHIDLNACENLQAGMYF